jgi:hypothetical protein
MYRAASRGNEHPRHQRPPGSIAVSSPSRAKTHSTPAGIIWMNSANRGCVRASARRFAAQLAADARPAAVEEFGSVSFKVVGKSAMTSAPGKPASHPLSDGGIEKDKGDLPPRDTGHIQVGGGVL